MLMVGILSIGKGIVVNAFPYIMAEGLDALTQTFLAQQ